MKELENTFSKEETKVLTEQYKKTLRERVAYLKETINILNTQMEVLHLINNCISEDAVNLMSEQGELNYPIHDIVHNVSVRCPDYNTPMFTTLAIEITNYAIQKTKEKIGWKLRFLKRNKDYVYLNKLLKELQEVDKDIKDGNEVVRPFAATMQYLQFIVPEKSSYMFMETEKICKQSIEYTETSINSYSLLKIN